MKFVFGRDMPKNINDKVNLLARIIAKFVILGEGFLCLHETDEQSWN